MTVLRLDFGTFKIHVLSGKATRPGGNGGKNVSKITNSV